MTRRFDFSSPILRAVILAIGLIILTAVMSSTVWRLSSITSARHILQLRNKFTHFTHIIPRHSSYGALKSFAFNHIEQWRK